MIDAQGRITQVQISDLFPAQFTYDTRGRPASIVQGSEVDARTVIFDYNEAGYLKTMTDPLAQQTHYEYDDAARIKKEKRPDGNEIAYDYDGSGNVTSVIPPGHPPHVFRYTSMGLLEEYVPPSVGPGSNSTLFRYNQDRQLAQVVRPDGLTLNYAYDNAGRLGTLETPTGVLRYAYDGATGKLASVTTPEGNTLSYAYNGALLAQIAWGGQIVGTVSRTFDTNLRTVSIRVNALGPFNFEYDEDSLLKKAGDLVLTRNPQNGLVTGTTLGKVTDSYTYNGFGEVTDYIVSFSGSPILPSSSRVRQAESPDLKNRNLRRYN